MPQQAFNIIHLENLVFTGPKNTRTLINALRKGIDYDIKWDGSSIYFGKLDNKFFVATKRIFNDIPKYYFTPEEIDEDKQLDEDVAKLMKYIFAPLKVFNKDIKSGTVVAADLMFTDKIVDEETIDGEKYTTFQSNLQVYTLYYDSPTAARVRAARLGLAVHTLWKFDGLTEPHSPTAWLVNKAYKGIFIMPNEILTLPAPNEELLKEAEAIINELPTLTEEEQMRIRREINLQYIRKVPPDVIAASIEAEVDMPDNQRIALDRVYDIILLIKNEYLDA